MDAEQHELRLGLKVAEKMIDDMKKRLEQSIKDEDWQTVFYLDAYIKGMIQIQTVFERE